VSKGKALEALAQHLDVSLSETIAVGDGSNDLTLLSTAGFSVAMANAPDRIKAVADHVTGTLSTTDWRTRWRSGWGSYFPPGTPPRT